MSGDKKGIVNIYAKLPDYKAKRGELLANAAKARHIQKRMKDKGYEVIPTINHILLTMIYTGGEQLEWNSFNQWKKKGKRVKKGEKAWLVFSRPIKVLKAAQGASKEELDDIEPSLYGTQYVFNNLQVQ